MVGVPALWSEERLLSIKGTQIEIDARMMRAEWLEAAEAAVATHPGMHTTLGQIKAFSQIE